jgi:hypothetical protein
MPRTTINIDPTVLDALRERARREGKPIGSLVSELLRTALTAARPAPRKAFRWIAKPMGEPAIDLSSNAEVWEFLDREALQDERHGADD